MGNDILERLYAIDPAILLDIVRQDQKDPFFKIAQWNVKRLSDKGIANPNGLWLFSGEGSNGEEKRSWSVVLKILGRQEEEPPAHDLWYWKREHLLAQSGLTENSIVKAPRFYHSEELPDGAWVWMEHVEDHSHDEWTLDEYAFAAHHLGRWNSAYLTGTSLPDKDWLTRQHYRTWLSWMNVEEDWKVPLNQKYVSKEARNRYDHLWNEREKFYEALESLPQVFSHFDCQRRNLFIRQGKDQQRELVVLDWAQCGIGAVGGELNWLVGMSSALLEWPASDLFNLDRTAFQSYIQGLQEGGWSGDVNIVRLGYVAMLAVFMGCVFPGFTAWWCSSENRASALQIVGFAEEELFLRVLPLLNYALDCADEARSLMKKPGLL
jgi:hypothetical protein